VPARPNSSTDQVIRLRDEPAEARQSSHSSLRLLLLLLDVCRSSRLLIERHLNVWQAISDPADDDQPPSKRGPPRHFHSAGLKRRKPELCDDVPQCIYDVLEKAEEVALLTRVSKVWLGAAAKMKSREWTVRIFSEDALRPLLRSPLRRHVTQLVYLEEDKSGDAWLAELSIAAAAGASECRPHLTTLVCKNFGFADDAEAALAVQPHLTRPGRRLLSGEDQRADVDGRVLAGPTCAEDC
jgi:hypothetical protein